jgi:hypothetical protein
VVGAAGGGGPEMDDADRTAGALAGALAGLAFTDQEAEQVTELLTEAVLSWAAAEGWRAYRRARSVLPLPPPYSDRHSWVDVGIARPDGPPVVVEIDQSDRRRTVEKLLAEAAAGRVALWLRWGTGPFAAPPTPVRLVGLVVTVRRDGGRRLFSTPVDERPPPSHSGVDLTVAQQDDLFGLPEG